ncbi:MAG: hypothetical protein WC380_00165 [Pedobacter sp.]|jgi:P pilus assembly chaperone PapD
MNVIDLRNRNNYPMLLQFSIENSTIDFCNTSLSEVGDEIIILNHIGLIKTNIVKILDNRQAKPYHQEGIIWQRVLVK